MTALTTKKHLPTLLIGMAVLFSASIYSCNDSETKDEATETVMPVATDTMMQMHSDTIKTDTGHKGSQPTPPRN